MLASPIGSYQPGTSPLHRLDPRVKSIAIVVGVFSVFAATTPAKLAIAVCGVALAWLASGCGARAFIRSLAPIAPFAAIVALFNLLAVQGGTIYAQLGPLALTQAGTWAALLYAARLLLAVGLGALLLLTTTPTALTDAFESLLSPLGRLGAPAHEIALVMSLALRFVPIISGEAQSVMDAQAARGGGFEEGGPLARLRALGAVLVPVFAGTIRHADNLSRALDARGYEGGAGRTHYHELRIRALDVCAAVAAGIWCAALVLA